MRCSTLLVPGMALAIINVACVAALAQSPAYHLGKTPIEEEIRAVDIAIGPEGKELPPGSGTAKQGAEIYAERCALCHGPTGAEPESMTPRPVSLVGKIGTPEGLQRWPFATTIWDYTNRAMPLALPMSMMPMPAEEPLTADEVYALTAWMLWRNGLIQETDVMDAKSLPKIQMPNQPKREGIPSSSAARSPSASQAK